MIRTSERSHACALDLRAKRCLVKKLMRSAAGDNEMTTDGRPSPRHASQPAPKVPTRKELRVAAAFRRVRDHISIEQASIGMIAHRVVVPARDVVFVKGVLEASEGVAAVFAESGGELSLVAPQSRVAALSEILADLGIDMNIGNGLGNGLGNGNGAFAISSTSESELSIHGRSDGA